MADAGMRERRRGRRWAMKALFMWDAQGAGAGDARALVDEAMRMEAAPADDAGSARAERASSGGRSAAALEAGAEGEAARFARDLVAGTLNHLGVIDGVLDGIAPAWGPGRMAAVDRALLRIGCYEVMYTETPAAVAVSEAVDLARGYSTAESPRFVNGVLGAVAPRPAGEREERPRARRAGAAAPVGPSRPRSRSGREGA